MLQARTFNGSDPETCEDVAGMAQAAAAGNLAAALITGFQLCEDAGLPLSGIQQRHILEGALLEFDGLRTGIREALAMQELLRQLRHPTP